MTDAVHQQITVGREAIADHPWWTCCIAVGALATLTLLTKPLAFLFGAGTYAYAGAGEETASLQEADVLEQPQEQHLCATHRHRVRNVGQCGASPWAAGCPGAGGQVLEVQDLRYS
ncbi:hypothetical protein ACXZ65_17185 [Streptomyces aculeolatus]